MLQLSPPISTTLEIDNDVASCISDPDSMWCVRLKLFFTCTVSPEHSLKFELGSWTLSYPHSVCWQGRGPPWAGSTLSLLSWWKHHSYHSIQVCCTPEAGLWIWLCWLSSRPGITRGCGNSADPSLELEGFQSQKQKESAKRPGWKHPSALGRPGRPASVLLKEYDMCIPSIYLWYKTVE